MLQQDYLFPWKTIEENILLGLKLIKKDEGLERIKTLKLLSDVGLGGTGKLYPRELLGRNEGKELTGTDTGGRPKILGCLMNRFQLLITKQS